MAGYDRLMVGQRLRDLRRRKGLTVEQLGESIGISTSHVNQIERGSKNMSIDLFIRFIKFFEVNPEDILRTGMKSDSLDCELEKLPYDQQQVLKRIFKFAINTVS